MLAKKKVCMLTVCCIVCVDCWKEKRFSFPIFFITYEHDDVEHTNFPLKQYTPHTHMCFDDGVIAKFSVPVYFFIFFYKDVHGRVWALMYHSFFP